MLTARTVTFQIKQGKRDEFTKLFNTEVLPTLKSQDGFESELALVQDTHASAISVWKDAESAKKYETEQYPQLVKRLEPVMVGAPRVETSEVAVSTLT